ncbi:cadherin-like beta sandwich domain-containing protein [Microbacterium halophytorum]|uniref:cadherin-like beta sandwich domain-containing protein n=1 Tax=Microbacterium halophytorum TaxID=2067568 RepID=UPI000CFDEFEC|nr:cadherin-like beta sandwich domain-containing protein [Microbacterium halophytorum]
MMYSKNTIARTAIGAVGGLLLASLSAVAVAQPDDGLRSNASAASTEAAGSQTAIASETDEISQEVFDQIYEEVKTPYEYGMVLSKGEQIADFDSELTDQMNVFRIPGDDEYVYTTYVGKDINRKTDGTDDTGYSTGLARSKDMVSWEKLGVILEPDGGFYSGSTAGYLVKEHQWGELPTPHSTEDGKYALTVLATDENGYEQGNKRGGVAFSETTSFFDDNGDVAEFEMHPEPVLDGSASYENGTIWAVKTIWDEATSRYVAFYNASHGPEVMNQAYSTDLINWDREEANPVLTPFEQPNGETWGTLYNGDADVVKIGDYWVMFYFTDTPVKIGDKIKPNNVIDSFAVSKDMVNWQKSAYKLTAKNDTYARSYAHKPAVVKKNGVVYHYYNAVAYQERGMALATSVDLSPVREAKHILQNSNDALLADLLAAAQNELIRDGGSLEHVTAALKDLRLYLHPESDSGVMNATVAFNVDGMAHEAALAPSADEDEALEAIAYSATIPSAAENVRLHVTPSSPYASVRINGETVSPSAGTGVAFDPDDGAAPLEVVVTSRDGTSQTAYTMVIASDAASAGPEVAVETGSRCVAGAAYLTVRVTNDESATVDATLSTPYGEKSLDDLGAGASRSVALNSRTDAFPAGAVELTSTTGDVTAAVTADYEAASCG